jgi:dsRNA-specific ribonuclease
MKSISFLFPVIFLFPLLGFSESLKPAEDRRNVEFFEKLYGTKIMGVKPIEQYQDPDTFYSEIAKQVGIPEIVYEAVEKKFGWKNDEENFLALMIKGGGNSDDWGVMVTRIPNSIKVFKAEIMSTKSEAEKKEIRTKMLDVLKDMEMRMVVVGYNGKISFPKKKK